MSRPAYCGHASDAALYRRMLLWTALLGLSLLLVAATLAASVVTAVAPTRQK